MLYKGKFLSPGEKIVAKAVGLPFFSTEKKVYKIDIDLSTHLRRHRICGIYFLSPRLIRQCWMRRRHFFPGSVTWKKFGVFEREESFFFSLIYSWLRPKVKKSQVVFLSCVCCCMSVRFFLPRWCVGKRRKIGWTELLFSGTVFANKKIKKSLLIRMKMQ